jgi:hypothetical protein
VRGSRLWWGSGLGSVVLWWLVAATGDSAAVPGLGAATWTPPWDLAALLDRTTTDGSAPLLAPWLVTPALDLAVVLGAVSLVAGWRALRPQITGDSRLPAPLALLTVGAVAALAFTVVPPAGSADHLSYLAYGRIAAAGEDPYAVPPADWRGGTDAVAAAVQPPWQHTPDVYGPAATAAMRAAALGGHGSLRLTLWLWQLLCAAAFVTVGWLLHRTVAPDRRVAAHLLWTVNPLLLTQLVGGAHVDVLAAVAAVAAVVVAGSGPQTSGPQASGPQASGWWRPVAAGALVGLAAAIKVPYALVGVGLLLAPLLATHSWRPWRWWLSGLAGGVAVVVPAFWSAGPHALDQLRTASGFTTIASPWRAVVAVGEHLTSAATMRQVVAPLAVAVAVALAAVLVRRWRVRSAAGLAAVLALAWVLTAAYALPWYDALVWPVLALALPWGVHEGETEPAESEPRVPVDLLVPWLAVRLAVLAVAYLPGRVVGLTPGVESVTLGLRHYLAPVMLVATVVAVLVRNPAGPRRRA